jgi:hypothetical protein
MQVRAAAGPELFGDFPAAVGSGVVNYAARIQIQIDVVVLAVPEPGAPRRILSLGEAKWGEVMGTGHVRRLERARDILAGAAYDTSGTVLACYSAAGFPEDLSETDHLRLFDLDRIYAAPQPAT